MIPIEIINMSAELLSQRNDGYTEEGLCKQIEEIYEYTLGILDEYENQRDGAMTKLFDYRVSYEVGDGERLSTKVGKPNIFDVIKEVRKEHPDAKMFRVLDKVPKR